MKKYSIIPQRIHTSETRITVLAASHFLADMLGGLLPGILPVALVYFQINLGMGVVILTSMSIGCNIMQIPASLLDRTQRRPRLLSLGLAMAGMIVLLAALPPSTPFVLICLLMGIVGVGIAIVHPIGLRGIQQIGNLSQSVTTPTFMTGGFLGASMGPWVSAMLVGSFGLKGLYWMILPVLLMILAIRFSNVKLAIEHPVSIKKKTKEPLHSPLKTSSPWSFLSLFLIGTFLNMGTTTIQALLPSYLVGLHFPLQFGGLTAMLFGIGSAIGSISIGFLVKKYKSAPFVLGGLALGIPLVMIYFQIATHPVSCLLMFGAGLLASSAFPLLVSLSRDAKGTLGMSTRMGVIVGGTWGIAGFVLLLVGQIASRFRLETAMQLSWIFYLCALLTAILTLQRNRLRT